MLFRRLRLRDVVERPWGYVVRHQVWSAVLASLAVAAILAVAVVTWNSARHALFGSSARVETIEYSFSANDPTYSGTRTVDGQCWITSLAAARFDSWRCAAGHLIYDPCFEPFYAGDSAKVICPGDPRTSDDDVALTFERDSAEAQLAEFRGAGPDWYNPRPWFFVAGDLGCARATGTQPLTPLGLLTFICGPEGPYCTEPTEEGATWLTRCVDPRTTSEVKRLVITELWR
jgi:hypothetical protein